MIIISYEADLVPFETTSADMLTQFFTDYNNIRTSVRSYIIGAELPARELVHMPNYVKKLCDVFYVANDVANPEYGPSPATFLLCHGFKQDKDIPAWINFGEDRHMGDDTRHVWECRPKSDSAASSMVQYDWENQVFLLELINQSGVVFLMCCYSEHIVGLCGTVGRGSQRTYIFRICSDPALLFDRSGGFLGFFLDRF